MRIPPRFLAHAKHSAPALFALLLLVFAAAGCSGQTGGVLLRAVAPAPFLDRPAQLTAAYLISDVDSGTLAAVIVNFPGQTLRAESINMNIEKPAKGTLGEILKTVLEPYKFDLFEVRRPDGKLLGYLMAHKHRLAGYYLEGDQTLILRGRIPRPAGDAG